MNGLGAFLVKVTFAVLVRFVQLVADHAPFFNGAVFYLSGAGHYPVVVLAHVGDYMAVFLVNPHLVGVSFGLEREHAAGAGF